MNFDVEINRKNTASMKWDTAEQLGKPVDVLPLWVADMDFRAPKSVLEALRERVEHGIFGYTLPSEDYYKSVIHWMSRRHDWKIKKDWIIIAPGIVPVIHFAVQAFTKEGDGVLIQRPVYYPFTNAIENNGRKVVNSSLVLKDNRYEMDFEDVEKKIIDNKVKLFILCSPHNPVSRVWTKEELLTIGQMCLKHDVLVIADEIHHDLVFKGFKHTPFAKLGQLYSNICITCTAPSKTFNLAGLQISNIIIENKDIREKLLTFMTNIDITMSNTLGLIACEFAYNTGEEWLEELLRYIENNKLYVQKFISQKLPNVKIIQSEGTYLLWMDFRGLGLPRDELNHFITHKAKLWLHDGYVFGEEGNGFQRINIACPCSILEKALNRLEEAVSQ